MSERLKILILAPHLDGHDVGESLTAYKLVHEMSRHADLTVLALECTHGPPLREQLPNAEVFTWPEPGWLRRNERMRAMLRPNIFVVSYHAKKWLRTAMRKGRNFDIAHQILPRAPRYPSIFRHFEIPYIVGSLGGALETPSAFRAEAATSKWYSNFRALDQLRFKYDPILRRSYSGAELVLGVAPYMQDVLSDIPLKRFLPFLGIGIEDVVENDRDFDEKKPFRLLHVGRAVRTKGLRDVVRAIAHLKDHQDITLISIGDGEEIAICKAEAEELGIIDRVEFLGKLQRPDIERYYRDADLFVFPSFRESMGGVLFEAMRWGLPILAVAVGGPDYIVGKGLGEKIELSTPVQTPRDVANKVLALRYNPALRRRYSLQSKKYLQENQTWSNKAKEMLSIYQSIGARSCSSIDISDNNKKSLQYRDA